jgi:hypothetical protein
MSANVDGQLSRQGFILTQVRRANRNSFLWNGLGLALFLAVAALSATYYYLFFFGPFPADDQRIQELARNAAPSELLSYLELKDRKLIPTGWKEISTSDDKVYAEAAYFLTPVGDDYLLVLAKSPGDGAHLVGPVAGLGQRDQEVVAEIAQAQPEFRGRILPVMLNNTAAFTVIGYIGLAVGLPWLLVMAFNIGRAIWFSLHPLSHPAIRRLAKYGERERIATEIECDVARGPVMQFGKAKLTPLWIVRPTLFGFRAVPLSELVWIYHLRQSHESFAVLCFNDGKTIPLSLKAEKVDALVAEVATRVPWAITGYDQETLKAWRNNKTRLIASVEERKRASLGK